MVKKSIRRKYIQIISALLYNANFKGFAEGRIYQGELKNICVPGLNCYSCPGAIGACPLGSFQNAIYSSGKKIPFYIIGTLLLLGVIFGRVICGFLCPFGLFQELLYKIPSPKIKKNKITRILSKLKYIILIVFVFLLSIIKKYPAFCKYICPAGTIEGGIALSAANKSIAAMLGSLFAWKLSVMVIIVIGAIFIYRDFCRFICPLGAIYSFFNKVAILGVCVDKSRCDNCGRCVRECKMDVAHVGDAECIQCGECRNKCHKNAIVSKINLKENGVLINEKIN